MVTADLLSRARAGDGEAFRELAESHRRELQVHCYRMLGSFADAEDAVQETMLAAWQGIGGFTEHACFYLQSGRADHDHLYRRDRVGQCSAAGRHDRHNCVGPGRLGDGDAGWRHLEHDVSAGVARSSAGSNVRSSGAEWRYWEARHRHGRFRGRRASRCTGHN
jgi:hypothetical protein